MSQREVILPKEMQDAIERCHEQCRTTIDRFLRTVDAHKVPPLLYHYTDGAGLLGILESGQIRLTDIFRLNDPSELRHGFKRACEILVSEAHTAHPAAALFTQGFMKLDSGMEGIARLFVACFSRSADDLGQWRAYGDNGNGFALGFDGAALERRFVGADNTPIAGNSTFPVGYDDDALSSILLPLVREILPLIAMPAGRKLENPVINEFMKELSVVLSLHVVQASLFFKHPAYLNEEEYRFLHIRAAGSASVDLKHRVRRNSLVQFIDFEWHHDAGHALKEIVIGPAADEDRTRSLARECLHRSGMDPDRVNIRRSSIPYRG